MGTKLWQVLPRQQRIIQQQFEHQLWVVPLNGLPCMGRGRAATCAHPLTMMSTTRHAEAFTKSNSNEKDGLCHNRRCCTKGRQAAAAKQRNLLLSHFKSSPSFPLSFVTYPNPFSIHHLTLNLCVCTANYEWPKFVSTLLRPQMNCQYTCKAEAMKKNLFSGSRRPQICPRTQLLLNYGNCGHRTRQ